MFLQRQFSQSNGALAELLAGGSSPLSLAIGRGRDARHNADHVDDPASGCLTLMSDGGGDAKPATAEAAAITPETADEATRPITVGGSVSGVIDFSGDTDVLTVSLVAGQTYMVSLMGTGATPLPDAYLTVSNPSGSAIASDDDGGNSYNSLVTFTASVTGTYTIAAQGYPGAGLTGGYTVDVRQKGTDSVGATIATSAPAIVDAITFGFLETTTDIDMYSVTLTAGTFYNIGLAGGADYNTPNSVPAGELDTIVSIYNSAGQLVATHDNIASDDFSSALGFAPDADGTYYIKVDAKAGQSGGYALDIDAIDLSTMDPLDTIDWGTQLPSTNVTVYFATAGQTFDGVTSLGWTQYEKDQAMAALQTWAEVSGLTFSITTNSSTATFKLVTTTSNEFLGYFNPPGTTNPGVGVFATNGTGWDNTGGLEEGGYGFITLVHEFGHGLGLAHPHDNGGTSEVMPGVTSPFNSFGVYDLNQGVYTTMSYNDGWQLHPDGPVAGVNYGYQAGPGAFDIALIQIKYGASSNATGDNVYVLPTANAAGAFWDVIWDTGGTDSIVHNGTIAATIDLTAATLDYSATGAGVISFVNGIYGGFTIAAGVVIENASGGSGADTIIGNSASNLLDGGAGNDTLEGRGGNDIFKYETGDGQDTITDFGSGDTLEVHGYTSVQSITQSGSNVVALFAAGHQVTFLDTTVAVVEAGIDLVDAPPPPTGPTEGDDNLTGTGGDDVIDALGGNDTINGLAGGDTLYGGTGYDTIYGGEGLDYLHGGDGDDIIYAGDTSNFTFPEYIWDGAGNDFVYGEGGQDIIYGSAGNDSYDGGTGGTQSFEGDAVIYSAALGGILVDMRLASGQVVSIGAADAANVGVDTLINIEGVTGSAFADTMIGRETSDAFNGGDGNDTLTGNGGGDNLTGAAGNDVLNGGTGADSMTGGLGDDRYYVDIVGDVTSENAGEGYDTVFASLTWTLGANVEKLILTGSGVIAGYGNSLDNLLIGNSGANRLEGLGGNDTLNGLGGADTLVGGLGNDQYQVDSADAVVENAGEGTDTVFAAFSYVLGANVERLILNGTDAVDGTGNELANLIAGNSAANNLYGLAGNDAISGGSGDDVIDGGIGNDSMSGGLGDDTFHVDSTGDGASENAGEGYDTVYASASHALRLNVERLILTGTAIINGTGSSLANLIIGNSAANVLSGLGGDDELVGGEGNDRLDGGTGIDTMTGGIGDDNYYVDTVGDLTIELAGEGYDTVFSSVTHVLQANVEKLLLSGGAAIAGTGNALANLMIGNNASNTLDGMDGDDLLSGQGGNDLLYGGAGIDVLNGNAGNDTMYGGLGDDTYHVDSSADVTVEAAGEGYDTIISSVSHILAANFERLILTGTGAIDGTGNGLANVVIGNAGANRLEGAGGNDTLNGGTGNDTLNGGIGSDSLFGGAGSDLFEFSNGDAGGDRIQDFSQLDADRIDLHLIDADTLTGGDQAFSFIGTNAFTGTAGELRYVQVNGLTFIYGDTNGDGIADFSTSMTGSLTLTGGDFVI